MLEIVVQGRGGQGAQTAGQVLAAAFFAEGRAVQSFSTYGGARRGTPVSSFIRVDDAPIRLRCDIERADAILCFDPTLLDARLLAAADERTTIVVNAARTPAACARDWPGRRVVAVDALAIARRAGLDRIVNSALLGAFACAVGAPSRAALERAIRERSPSRVEANLAACAAGYEAAAAFAGEEATA